MSDLHMVADLDGHAHVLDADDDGNVHYRRATPNADRTAWTWDAPPVLVAEGDA